MIKTQHRVVLDTNVFISAILFGGKPRQIIQAIRQYDIEAYTSRILIAELLEILVKKFSFPPPKITLVEDLIQEYFTLIYPSEIITIARDEDDNRVLEAAKEGKCQYIITGDKNLLTLHIWNYIQIVTPDKFLEIYA